MDQACTDRSFPEEMLKFEEICASVFKYLNSGV